MRILVPTRAQDVHATVVQRALAHLGHDAVLTFGADLAQRSTLSLALDPRGRVETAGAPFDVVWLRRPTEPVLPSDLHPDDVAFTTREWRAALEGVWRVAHPSAFWVNPRAATSRAACKPAQLVEAARVGLRVPRTLISNDPAEIAAFVRSNPGGTVYKPFGPGAWTLDDGGGALLYTSVVTEADLADEDAVRAAPGLYQPRLDKAYELRVTVMGRRVFASRLDSQDVPRARVDWRAADGEVHVAPIELAPALEARCRALVEALGLTFGCLDLVVEPSGEPVFLEVNPMGQFLWLEEANPEHRLLDAFCALLTEGPDFARPRGRVRLADFTDPEADAAIDAAHLASGSPF